MQTQEVRDRTTIREKPKFRPASVEDYVDWLEKYLAAGGKPTHYYDYPMSRAELLVALNDFTLAGECGAFAKNIIVLPGVRFTGQHGHNDLYCYDELKVIGGCVPIYNDPEFHTLPVQKFIREQKRKDFEWRRVREARDQEYQLSINEGDIAKSGYGHGERMRGYTPFPAYTPKPQRRWRFGEGLAIGFILGAIFAAVLIVANL